MPTLDAQIRKFPSSKPWLRALKERKTIPAKPAVYAIVTNRKVGRLVGKSKVLYVGQTGRLGGDSQNARLRAYTYPSGPKDKRVKKTCIALITSGHTLRLRWQIRGSAKQTKIDERKLLHRALRDHSELPPLNNALPRKKP